jgi:ketosteroid isomerase-like protein
MPETFAPVTAATLEAFSDAWNRHDIDALMAFMTDDCVFMTAGGPDACGTRHVGSDAVRKAFPGAWVTSPDAQWRNGKHFVQGDFGVSQWTFTGTAPDGSHIESDGVDIFSFRDGKIAVKNVFRKNRPNLPATK